MAEADEKILIEIAVRENLQAVLKEMMRSFETANAKVSESRKLVVSLSDTLSFMSKTTLGVAAGIAGIATALDAAATNQMRLRNTAADLGVSTSQVQEFGQQFRRSGMDLGKANAQLTDVMGMIKQSGAYLGTDEFTRALRMSAPALANQVEELSRAGKNTEALTLLQREFFRQGELGNTAWQRYFLDITHTSRSFWQSLRTDLRGSIKDWEVNADAAGKYKGAMEDLKTSGRNVWTDIAMHATKAITEMIGGTKDMDENARRTAKWFNDEIDRTIRDVRNAIQEFKDIKAAVTGEPVSPQAAGAPQMIQSFREKIGQAAIVEQFQKHPTEGLPWGYLDPELRGPPIAATGASVIQNLSKFGTAFGHQHGGIFTSPTTGVIGEAGPEARVPLGGGGSIISGSNDLLRVEESSTDVIRDISEILKRMETSESGGIGRGTSLGRYGATGAPGGGMGPRAQEEVTRRESGPDLPSIADAIQKQEGWFPGSRSQRNNNPGNLKFGPRAQRFGATGMDDQGHAVFPDYAAGRAALEDLLKERSGESLNQIGRGTERHGGFAEDPGWATGVAKNARIDPNQPLDLSRPSAAEVAAADVLPDQSNRPYRIKGTIAGLAQPFHYGSGGSNRGSVPFGTQPITPGYEGPLIRSYGGIAINKNIIYDPKYPNRPREGIAFHAASSSDLDRLYSEGCFAIANHEWPAFKQQLLTKIEKEGPQEITVYRDQSASIDPVGTHAKIREIQKAIPDLPHGTSFAEQADKAIAADQPNRALRLRARVAFRNVPKDVRTNVSSEGITETKTERTNATITYAPHTRENPGNVPVTFPAPLAAR